MDGDPEKHQNKPVILRKGEKIEDYYDVKEELGKGRFGKVYRCIQKSTGEPWAAKFIKAITQKDKQAVRAEIAIMNQMNHANLLRCVDAFEVGSKMAMVLEIVSGGELFERVISEDFDLSEGDVIIFMRQICEGVQYMHENSILHLDLKPENILCVDKTGHRIKLIDFGLARKFQHNEDVKVMFGTPEFVAPEVVNYEQISFATDMWSVGVICYVLLSGLSPFMGDSDAETLNNVTAADWDFEDDAFDNISEDAKDFIEQLLIKRKEKRLKIRECLRHAWLQYNNDDFAANKLSKERLRKFVARRRWQKTTNAVRAIGRMTALRLFSNLKKSEANAISPKENTPESASTNGGENLETTDSYKNLPKTDFSITTEIDLTSTEVSKAGKAIQSAFQRSRPTKPDTITKSVTFAELVQEDIELNPIDSPLPTTSCDTSKRKHRGEASGAMDIDPGDPRVADAATKIQAVYRGHRTRKVVLQPPEILQPMRDCEVCEGSAAKFDCRIKGFPEPEIFWFKDGKEIEESRRFRVEFDDDDLCSLIILESEPDDEGKYSCEAKNCAGKTSCSGELLVEVLNANNESTEEEEEESVETTAKTRLPITNTSANRTFTSQAVRNSPSVSPIRPSFPATTAAKPAVPSSTAAKSSSLKVHLANVNTSKSGFTEPTSTAPVPGISGIQVRTVGGKNIENSRQKPAVIYNVSESRQPTTPRQVQGAVPAENKTTGNVRLKTHQSNGITPLRKPAPEKVTQPEKVYVRESKDIPRKTNIIGEPRHTTSIDVPRTASSKVQDAVNRLKLKSTVDETDKRTKSNMLRGQGIGALTAKFESAKESKPERPTTRKDPIITSKVSARKEMFNNNNGSSGNNSSGVAHKTSPARSVVERYTSPGKSASLKSKFEAKPEADKQPQFIRKPKGETASESDSVKFSCKASGVPTPSVSWQFKGKTLKDEGRHEIYTEKDMHYLEIFDLMTDDAGVYTCKLLNSTGRATASFELTVTETVRKISREKPIQEKPPVFDKKLKDCEVLEGEEARLECAVSGLPSPEVTWLFEGKLIAECKRRRITRNHDGTCALIISNVTEDDDAVYTCTAKNRSGSVSCTAEIIVEIKPSPRVETTKVETPKSVEKPRSFETKKKIEETSKKFENLSRREAQTKADSPVRTSPFRAAENRIDTTGRARDKVLNNNDIKNGSISNRNESPVSRLKSPPPLTQSQSKSLSLRPVPKPPKAPEFLVRLRSQTVTEPRTARFSCLVKGTPEPTVTWTKDDGEPLHDDGRIKLSEDKGEHKLEINETNTLDSGRYTCTLVNEAGKISASATLTVNAQYYRDIAPKFLQNLEDIKVKDGESAKFSCKITSSPKPTVQWLFKGKEIPPDDDVYEMTFDGSQATLSLSEVLPEDEGEYTCSVRNSKGSCACSARLIVQVEAKSPPPSTLSSSLKSETPVSSEPETIPDTETHLVQDPQTLPDPEPEIDPKPTEEEPVTTNTTADSEYCQCPTTVFTFPDTTNSSVSRAGVKEMTKIDSESKPEFVTKLENVEVVDGSPVVLSVKVKGEPLPDVMWIFDECEILEDDDFKLVQDGDTFSLVIREVYPEDAGEYICRLIGDNDVEVECTAQLVVKDPEGKPARFLQKPRSINVDEGSSVKLSCKMEGDPEPSLTWYKDDKEIKSGERFILGVSSIGGLHTLEIPAVLVTDAGNYTCTIKNDLGEESCTVAVRVQQLQEEQTDFRSLLKSRPRLQNIQSPSVSDRQPKKPSSREQEAEQVDFRHVLTRHVQTKKKPRFSKELESTCVKEGELAVFECNVEGIPEPNIAWAVNGKPIKESKYFQMSYDGKVARLTITEAFPEDRGEYKCMASNTAGQCATSGDLKVTPLDDDETEEIQYNTNNSNSASDIRVNGDIHFVTNNNKNAFDEPDYSMDNDIPTEVTKVPPPVAPKFHSVALSEQSSSEVTESAVEIHVGQSVEVIIPNSSSEQLTVNGGLQTATAPVFDEELRDESITKGSAARLQCRVLGDPEPDIFWYKDGRELHEGRKYRFEFEDDDVVALLINNASVSDLGIYTCKAMNRAGTMESSAQLMVEEMIPPKVEGGPTNLQVVAGQTLNISCKVSGRPTPDVIWYKDRKELREDDRIHLDSTGSSASLVITNAEDQDAGKYSLCLESDAGRDSFAISVSVVDKPEPPTGKPIASNVSRDGLTLSWSGAAYDGGSRIIGYIVEMCKTRDRKWKRVIRTSSTSHVLHDLESDVEYLFRVSAENAHGVSEPSENSDAILTTDDEDDVFSDCKPQDSDGKKPSNTEEDMPSLPEKLRLQHDVQTINILPHPGQKDVVVENITSSSKEREKVQHYDEEVKAAEDVNHDDDEEIRMNTSEIADQDDQIPSEISHSNFDEVEEDVVAHHVTIKKDEEMSHFYELKEQIGKGRFGVVYRCLDRADGKELAAKFIKTTPKEIEAVREEIAIMNALHHPKLLQCVDAFETPRQMILILEMIGGGELFERVIDDDFVLTERDVIKYMRQICTGVQHMHRQSILHLDLKPENIMCVDKTGSRIKLIDFGLARKFNPTENVKVMFGTPEFVAPEVINYEKINFATDMWSVGVICYILLSGLSPFMGDSDAETLSNVTLAEWDFEDEAFDDITEDAKEFIQSLLIKDLEKRKTVGQCLQDKWLIKDTNKMKACKISKENFKKFVARRRWQKTATAVRALGRMASLTMISGLKKLNSSDASPNGSCSDETAFSALRQKKEEEKAKKVAYLKEVLSASPQSNKSSPPPRSPKPLNPRPTTTDSKFSKATIDRDGLRSTKKPNGDVKHDSSEVIAPKFIKKMVDCEVLEGDHARFDCKIVGEPEPDITWLQDGIKIEESKRFIFDYDDDGMCSLIIKNAMEDDDAEYTFKASNSAGEISCTAELIVDLL